MKQHSIHWLRGYEAFILGYPIQYDNLYWLWAADMPQDRLEYESGWLYAQAECAIAEHIMIDLEGE